MRDYNIEFITRENFLKHVSQTVSEFKNALNLAEQLSEFNKNLVDPIKFLFDKYVHGITWYDLIGKEISRQRDKNVNNSIGYFHQNIFEDIKGEHCRIERPEQGWDLVVTYESGYYPFVDSDTEAKRIYVEMKNKHNTMNDSSKQNTYGKMVNQICEESDAVCFLVEAISGTSKNKPWKVSGIDDKGVQGSRIRRVSMDEFYGFVTGECDAFYQLCSFLPDIIQEAVKIERCKEEKIMHSSIYSQILENCNLDGIEDEEIKMNCAMYMLAFSKYKGFSDRHSLTKNAKKRKMKKTEVDVSEVN